MMIGGWVEHLELVAQMARQNTSRLIYHNTVAAAAGINSSNCFFISRGSDLCRCRTTSKTNWMVKRSGLWPCRKRYLSNSSAGDVREKSLLVGKKKAAFWQMLSVKQRERDWLARLDVTTSKRGARWGGWCNSVSKIPWKYLEQNGCDDSKAA